MFQKYRTFIFLTVWIAFSLLGLCFSPSLADEPRPWLSVLFYGLNLLSAVVMNVYEVKTGKLTGNLFQRMGI